MSAPLGLVATAGCDGFRSGAEAPAQPGQRVVVRSFTDAAEVRDVVSVPPYVVVATDAGVDRWHVDDRERAPLDLGEGVRGDDVRALASGHDDGSVWLVTSEVAGRYVLADDRFEELPRAWPDLLRGERVALAAGADDAVWIGGDQGLAKLHLDATVSRFDVGGGVTSLHGKPDGSLWVGTEQGLRTVSPGGDIERPTGGDDCEVGSVRRVIGALGGGVLALGDTERGQRIAVHAEGRCDLFRASPDERWSDVASTGESLVVLADGALYATPQTTGGARQLERDGMRLLPLSGSGRRVARDYRMRPVGMELPIGVQNVAISEDAVWVGTEERGTASLALDRPGDVEWLEREPISSGGSGLTVACKSADECFMATGATRLWRFDGGRVRLGQSLERPTLAVVARGRSGLHALRRGEEPGQIEILARVDGDWRLQEGLEVKVPGRDPELAFARLSPTGMLWLGLQYRDDAGQLRPFGVAQLDLSLGGVTYHRATADEDSAERGVLPVPVNAVDASFAGAETWLATSEGAAVVGEDGSLDLYTEADGLRSELLRGVAVNPGGVVFVASRAGIGVYDGLNWQFPGALRDSVRALDFAGDGRLWMATDRGLAAYDGDRVRRLDARRGLLEDELSALAVDEHDRVWVRGERGITVVVP